jgi:cysteine desulfurase
MLSAMDAVGNPSSVHAEGRAAKAIIERARAQIATAFGAEGADIVFTSGATEAAALALSGRTALGGQTEHDAVDAWLSGLGSDVVQFANSETGVLADLPEAFWLCDATQAWGKVPVAFNWLGARTALASAHKLGGPKGVGALILKRGTDLPALIKGGGQEMGRRSGTENVIGIGGFGAAAQAAQRDIERGVWVEVEKLRKILENGIAAASDQTIFVGLETQRLPNTSCFTTPGWKGETQVMAMDLAGFAISAGSACSSGKVRESRVLRAMGYDELAARSAVRVSLGPATTEDEIGRFVDAWGAAYRKFQARAA